MYKILASTCRILALSAQESFFSDLSRSHEEIASGLDRAGNLDGANKVRDLTKIILGYKWTDSRISRIIDHMQMNPDRLQKVMADLLQKPAFSVLFMDYDKENKIKQYNPNKQTYAILSPEDEYDASKHKNSPIQFIFGPGTFKIKIDHLYADGDGVRQILVPLITAYSIDIGWDILTLGHQTTTAKGSCSRPSVEARDLAHLSRLPERQATVLGDDFGKKLNTLYTRIQPKGLSDSLRVAPNSIPEGTLPIDVTESVVKVSVGLLDKIALKLGWKNKQGAPMSSQVLEYATQIALALCNDGQVPMGRAPFQLPTSC